MKTPSTIATLFIIILCIPTIAFGQGTLSGVVVDSVTNTPLVGANVHLRGTGLGSSADIEGRYRIVGVPTGAYTLRISYIGYTAKEFRVNVASREMTINARLTPDVVEGAEFVVTAQRRGQVAAINQQLTSNAIVNVVSEERIQELPDANAAAAIGRLSGVSLLRSGGEATQVVLRGLSSKFSTITIDGVRIPPTAANDREVDLSTISQGSLAGIELFKALTPDKDADAIAGSVNLVTRKASVGRLVRFDMSGNYNRIDNSADQYNFNGRYAERFFNDVLGVQLGGYLERIIRSNESSNYDWETFDNFTRYEMSQFSVTYLNETRKRGGGSILLDLNTPDNGSIRFNNVFSQTSRDYITHNRNYHKTGGVAYEYRDRESRTSTFSSSLRGENYLFGFEADWSVAFSESKVKNPYDYTMNFTESSSASPPAGMQNIPQEYWKDGPPEKWIPYAFNNFQAATLNSATDRNSRNYDKERTAYLNIGRKYTVSENLTGEVKIGGKYRSKSRSYAADETISNYYLFAVPAYARLNDGVTFVQKDFSGTRFAGLVGAQGVSFSNYLDPNPEDRNIYDKYRLYPLINRDDLRKWRDLNINGFVLPENSTFDRNAEYLRNDQIDAGNYSLTENISAAYVMNTLNVGQSVTVIAGLRVESDNNDYAGVFTPFTLSGFAGGVVQGYLYPIDISHRETMVLPNVQAIIRPTDFMNLRIAAYKALARPDFNHRLPKFIAKSSSGNTLILGNPELKNAVAWNYEAQTQFYGNNVGLFSVSAFYKDVKDMYHSLTNLPIPFAQSARILDSLRVDWKLYVNSFPLSGDYTLTYPYNSTKPTRVWGFEFEHQADLKFLPGPLKNIVLNYNFTIVRSETWITTTRTDTIPNPPRPPRLIQVIYEKKQKLESQPEFFANASLGYDYGGFSFRISFFHQGEFNRSFSFDQRSDGITDSYSRWDVALKQRITDFLSVIVNINNITNPQEGTSTTNRLTGWLFPDGNNKYGTTADLGVRIDL
jgi:TonB-dependent receptor